MGTGLGLTGRAQQYMPALRRADRLLLGKTPEVPNLCQQLERNLQTLSNARILWKRVLKRAHIAWDWPEGLPEGSHFVVSREN